jgi:metallo-beta-lactamase family protein
LKLSFHGADRNVTGSCHLLECAGKRVLIDCGMFQGSHSLDQENSADFGFDAAAVDYMLLTHAHLDHCGRLPLLSKRGFRGEVVTTAATRELARIVMLDAAHLQEEEAEFLTRREAKSGKPGVTPPPPHSPLYTRLDALNALDHFGRTADYGVRLQLAEGIHVTFLDAGHILGSASIHVELEEGGRKASVAFSGDLGSPGRPLLRDPVAPPKVDALVIETTYGDRRHRGLKPSVDELYTAINDAFQRGGNVVIPTFALERAQELLFYLREGVESNRLPPGIQVYLDSPMAISATDIFRRHPECYDAETTALFAGGKDPLAVPGLHFTSGSAESIAINQVTHGAVIMSGSGMATGGRVRHHLQHNLPRAESSVVFVGYAAKGTLARQIVDGAKKVHLFGEEVPVRARIHTIGGFSAHADQDELAAWQRKVGAPRTFLVHGEEDVMHKFAAQLRDTQVEMPALGQVFEL